MVFQMLYWGHALCRQRNTHPPPPLGMRHSARLLIALFLFVSATLKAGAGLIFQDGFESGSLGAQWTLSRTYEGRATVTGAFTHSFRTK